ncbi:MAG TPA: hypothetical protein VGJ33_00150 [Candidatus Angelobacter sp.]|jgi:hypothetical protein
MVKIIWSGRREAKAAHRHQEIRKYLGWHKVASMSGLGFMVLTLAFSFAPIQGHAAQKPPQQNAFDDRTASRLLSQLSEALQGHSQKQFLALFDFGRMKDGTLFRQQIESFFSQTESIRAHLNLAETAMEGDKATLAVDAEMETQPSNGSATLRRNERLSFVAASSGAGWKFVDVQPRGFFSLP